MSNYMQRNESSCKDCYKCIRHCTLKAISFSANKAHVVGEECILCGSCYVVCPQEVQRIRNDVGVTKKLIASKRPVYASVAPSFVANYPQANIRTMENALKKIGFFAAEETAVGATIVKKQYEGMVKENKQDIIISSCCHSVNTLIQKYYPEALMHVAHVLSPMQAHGKKIKEEHPDAYTVFIGPCISKKEEADLYSGSVDCVLTFKELSDWLAEEGVTFGPVDDDKEKGRARFFPAPGGILRSMSFRADNYSYMSVDGVENVISALKGIVARNVSKCFIEMSACAGSCIGGPAMDQNQRAPIRDYLAVEQYAGERDFTLTQPGKNWFVKEMPYIGLQRQVPDQGTINMIMEKMGKVTPEQELNCGICGYNTCREKAIAVSFGKANLTMCLPFLKEKAESFSDNIINNTPSGIIVLNEALEIQQINKSACRILDVKDGNGVVGLPVENIIDPTDYALVVSTENNLYDKQRHLQKHNRYVKETILYDKNYHIIISIMRDVTQSELERFRKEQFTKHTIEIADKVIEKQMRIVQEIASLLGETTAETKIVLTNLKETLRDDQ